MGQQQSGLKDEIKNKYTVIKTIAPGEYLVKGRRKGEELQLRILSFLVEDEMTQYINLLEKRKKIKNPHLLELIQYNKMVDQLMCSSTFKLKIVSQLPFKTIKDDIRQRFMTIPKKYFAQDELWSILYSCCHALYSLYINKFPHESLTTDQIYIDTDGIIKVGDSLLVHGTKNYLSLMNEEIKVEDIRYISPELKNLVDDNNFYQYQKEKSDVYILAMIILQISNLEPVRFFDPKTKRFHFEVISTVFGRFKERYSPKLYEIVNRMLTSDYNIRPSFEQIIQSIEEKTFHTNSNNSGISSKDSTIINDVNKADSQNITNNVFSYNHIPSNDLNQVRQKLNFDVKTSNNPINQAQPTALNSFLNFQQKIQTNSYSSFQPPPLFNNFSKAFPSLPNNNIQISTNNPLPTFDWKFDTVSKEQKRQNEYNYTPYQQLINLSGNATIPNSKVLPGKQDNFPPNQSNGIHANFPSINNQPIPQFNQDKFMKERRFSESKFGGIELGFIPNAQVTEKKQVKAPQRFVSYTQVKPLANQLFKKQKQSAQQEVIFDKGTFVIQENASGRYEGFKQNNQKNGIGRIIYTDGGSYEGQWKNDRMDGYGKLFYPNGKTAYEGYWVQDEFNGTGRVYNQLQENSNRKVIVNHLDFSDIEDKWEFYEGEFNHDLREGKGMIKFITGDRFYGTFKADVIQGEGSFHKCDGDVIQGYWSNNVFVRI